MFSSIRSARLAPLQTLKFMHGLARVSLFPSFAIHQPKKLVLIERDTCTIMTCQLDNSKVCVCVCGGGGGGGEGGVVRKGDYI